MMNRHMTIPNASDRKAWAGIEPLARDEILAEGSALAGGGYAQLTATQYMAYVRDGDRQVFEKPYFARRHRLIRACLAECVCYDGRYLDEVTDGLWCICEESTWCISAHNLSGEPLADIFDPALDLFAAQTASLVSWVCYLLEESLMPLVAQRVHAEVQRRVIQPFIRREDFWWMGRVRKDLNNWTPWILANTLAATHIWGIDCDERAAEILERWLDVIPQDGGLDEGISYWNMAGGSLLDCLEHLGAERYHEEKIKNLAAFPVRAHINGSYFINFADCDAKPILDGERVYTFGKCVENPALQALGTEICVAAGSVFPQGTPEFYRTLCALFNPVSHEAMSTPAPADHTLSQLQLWTRKCGSLYVAFKGGHNAENHNHNDIGSIIVYAHGEPAIVDAGNLTYTSKTFGDARYSLWNTRSGYHNVPLIGGYEQAPGIGYCAREVSFEADYARMDIALAYPGKAGALSCTRKVCVWEDRVEITDKIELATALPVTWVFLLREQPRLLPGKVVLPNLTLCYDESLRACFEEIPVQDAVMSRSFPGSLWRLMLDAGKNTLHRGAFTLIA